MVTDAAAFEDSEGLPFVVDVFEMLGETTAHRAVAGEATAVTPNTSPQTRRRELFRVFRGGSLRRSDPDGQAILDPDRSIGPPD